ncbi:hypothetical protein [Kutzneria buriramensis]|uniref:EPTP domain-containing protein n=1 Tax=Kutzneria buriramensis TaxID=1045776 RepID=A0A3E0HJE8_9PSEU|nr:hypothetical protein [Kutzneria buriramensis]REH46326.1 EPTP domain-containing protein [Kutzneria buriramensis]
MLTEWCRIPTSGARAVAPFEVEGHSLVAIPQLAYDVPGQPPHMNGGDSDTEMLILRRTADGYEPFQTVPAPGGEDAEFFRIGDRSFLATASIRTGHGPYHFDAESTVYEWTGSEFAAFQRFPTFAAKQWRHFVIGDDHFLALAQGVDPPGVDLPNVPSHIFRWDGTVFRPFQDIPSRWAYNWHHFTLDGNDFLAHADHIGPSRLYRWAGREFVAHQDLAEQHGRAFATFHADGDDFLLVGCIASPSRLLRWDNGKFVERDVLDGLGTREFAVHFPYVVRVNFILGTPAAPTTALTSQLYRWQQGKLTQVAEFPTSGGTDVAVLADAGGALVAVSNSLSADVRFRTDTVIYRLRSA